MIMSAVGKKTSISCLKDVVLRQVRHLAKKSCRYPKDVLNANLKVIFVIHLELPKICPRCLIEDVLKMSY